MKLLQPVVVTALAALPAAGQRQSFHVFLRDALSIALRHSRASVAATRKPVVSNTDAFRAGQSLIALHPFPHATNNQLCVITINSFGIFTDFDVGANPTSLCQFRDPFGIHSSWLWRMRQYLFRVWKQIHGAVWRINNNLRRAATKEKLEHQHPHAFKPSRPSISERLLSLKNTEPSLWAFDAGVKT